MQRRHLRNESALALPEIKSSAARTLREINKNNTKKIKRNPI